MSPCSRSGMRSRSAFVRGGMSALMGSNCLTECEVSRLKP